MSAVRAVHDADERASNGASQDGTPAAAAAAADVAAASPLRVCLFGGFAVTVRGMPLRKLRTRQGNRLLALLALSHGREVARTTLIARLWPDAAEGAGLASLRRALTDLRDALGTEAGRLESVGQFGLRLDLTGGGATCDVTEFEQALGAGTPDDIDRAIDLYRGPLMPDLDSVDDPEGMVRTTRDRTTHAFLGALERRAHRHRANRRFAEAALDYRQLLAADPTREAAAHALMQMLADNADRAGAIAAYQRLRRALSEELDARPERETRALYERLQVDVTSVASLARTGGSSLTATNRPITFLFTDIEGSTSLWDSHADAMGPALERHDALMRQAIDRSEGVVFKTVGDGFYAAFDAPADALEAAIEAQRLLAQETWSGDLTVRVRMAIHTGVAEKRDGDYFGITLSRLARLLATGWGGQILLSSATYEMVRDVSPGGIGLRGLGKHRFKDLAEADMLYQLTHPELQATFPSLRSLNVGPHNLPTRLTRFVGREAAVEAVRTLLHDNRLLTLTGTGGAGKTRLAQQVAADALDEYPDGVWQTELAALPIAADVALVARAILATLSIKDQPGQTPQQTLIGYLQDKQLLLLVDNCEHLLDACVHVVTEALAACPRITILATSREPLAVFGEQVYRVPSLTLPDPKRTRETAESLVSCEAVRLFVDRATLAKPGFLLTDANAPLVARLCRQLDGIPLALELAAARTRTLPLEQMASRLGDRFRLLTGGERAALPRQQTLRALIDWSYGLLTADEKVLFARLSVFAGGWTLEAAENVCDAEPLDEWAVLDLLTSLAEKSLVLAEEPEEPEEQDEQDERTVRYRMLETLREYATEKLRESGETESMRRRHGDWCLRLAEDAEAQFQGPEQNVWVRRLESDLDNLRAALAGGETPKTVDIVDREAWEAALSRSRLAGMLYRFWLVRGYLSEGRERVDRALAEQRAITTAIPNLADTQAEKAAAACALRGAGSLANRQNDLTAARAYYEESLSLYRAVGDKSGIADDLRGIGIVDCSRGDYDSARRLHTESIDLKREVGDKRGLINALNCLGLVHYRQGEYPVAQGLYRESLALSREISDKGGVANMLNSLGMIDYSHGDYSAAWTRYEECLELYRALGDKSGIASTLNCLGLIEHSRGDYAATRVFYEESLSAYREIGDKRGVASGLNCLGDVVLHEGDFATAQSHYSESLSLYRAIGDKRGMGNALNCLGNNALKRGDPASARSFYEEGLRLKREIGDRRGVANTLNCLGGLALGRDEAGLARPLYEEGLRLSREIGDKRSVNDAIRGMAKIAFHDRNFAETMTLSGAAYALGEAVGAALVPEPLANKDPYNAKSRTVLGDDAADAAWNRGRAMLWEQAVAYALGEGSDRDA